MLIKFIDSSSELFNSTLDKLVELFEVITGNSISSCLEFLLNNLFILLINFWNFADKNNKNLLLLFILGISFIPTSMLDSFENFSLLNLFK